jgi:hypothetical protein
MKLPLSKSSMLISGLAIVSATLLGSGSAHALSSSSSTSLSATDQTKLTTVITKGDQEITRRLQQLETLSTKISAATKLTSSDKSTLSTQVTGEISGLTALKSKLDADTTLVDAHADAESIYTEYRVYALITPKINLIKTADDQQVTESNLTTLAAKLQTRITAMKNAGKDTTAMQSELSDLTAKTTAAQAISSAIETKVIGLQPTDYNSDHAVLSDDSTQLKTAHTDTTTAIADAKQIVAQLKSAQ